MRPPWILALVVIVGAAASGCSNDEGPTSPSPTRTLTSVSVSPSIDLIKIKQVETFTVTANYSDGSVEAITPAWGTDAPGVASIENTGRVTGVGSGLATIFADYQGLRGTRLLRVVPDYHGRWEGDWSVTACTADGDLVGACEAFPYGEIFLLTLTVNQTRDQVTGTTDFGDNLPGPVTGSILQSGHLVVGGTYTLDLGDGLIAEVTVSNWETLTIDNQRMTGRLRLTGRVPGFQGAFSTDGELRIVTKTSANPARVAASGARPAFGRALAGVMRRR